MSESEKSQAIDMTESKNTCFDMEIKRMLGTLEIKTKQSDLTFALVADSHLDDREDDTRSNLRAVDKVIGFDFMVHLGDFMNGNLPRYYTKKILREEMEKFRNIIKNNVFYPVQGNHDGYCDVTTKWQVNDVALDEDWYETTNFTENDKYVVRKKGSPYYYVDYPEKKIRLVILCSFTYIFDENRKYQKLYQMDEKQLIWLKEEVLVAGEEWTLLFFSHDGPLKIYDQDRFEKEPWNGNSRELLQTVISAREVHGFSIAAWFIGHWHGELCQCVQDIPFVIIGSQTAYVPQLWSMPAKGHYAQRKLGTVSQDLWDGVVLNKTQRTLYLCRFGAGEDRIIRY